VPLDKLARHHQRLNPCCRGILYCQCHRD
jgi:hypothetical protein